MMYVILKSRICKNKRSNLIGHGDELDLRLVPRFTAALTLTPTLDKYFGGAPFSGSEFLIHDDEGGWKDKGLPGRLAVH